MKNISIISLLILSSVLFSCKNQKQKDLQKIQKLENEINNSANTSFDLKKAEEYIKASTKYVETYPKDTNCAPLLFKSANYSLNFKDSEKASDFVIIIDKLLNDYPDFKKIPEALFLKAFYLENNMQNKEMAVETYKEFISKYPNHQLAKDAKKSIELISIPIDDLIKIFEKRNDSLKKVANNK
ncbi:MAG: tetratricopeptide repeat protein [Bacteroidales bacterium]|nr:tetratricopeptide repeat protein [Bacteroidales bacterium]